MYTQSKTSKYFFNFFFNSRFSRCDAGSHLFSGTPLRARLPLVKGKANPAGLQA
jgi:hypothetical protein